MDTKLQKVVDQMPAFTKREDTTMEQFADLERIAVKIGAYNAADALHRILNSNRRQLQRDAAFEEKRAQNES